MSYMAEAQETPEPKETPKIFDYIAYNKIGDKNYEFDRIRDATGNSISLPQIKERTLLEVETERGTAFYKPGEGDLSKRIISKIFEKSGFPTPNPPFFLKRLFPAEKNKLVNEGYQVMTVDKVAAPLVASPV